MNRVGVLVGLVLGALAGYWAGSARVFSSGPGNAEPPRQATPPDNLSRTNEGEGPAPPLLQGSGHIGGASEMLEDATAFPDAAHLHDPDPSAQVEPPQPASLDDALAQAVTQISPTRAHASYVRLVGPLLSDLEPSISEDQEKEIEQYLLNGRGRTWLQYRIALDDLSGGLDEVDRTELNRSEAAAFNELREHLAQDVLTSDQRRYFPYGRRYHEQRPR